MTHPKILEMERKGFIGTEPKQVETCEYSGCEIMDYDDYYNLDELNEGIMCESCFKDWAREFIVRGNF